MSQPGSLKLLTLSWLRLEHLVRQEHLIAPLASWLASRLLDLRDSCIGRTNRYVNGPNKICSKYAVFPNA